MIVIEHFAGKYAFLSNFYPATVVFDQDAYPSVEHAYQAAKTFSQRDRDAIRVVSTPGKAKRLGQTVEVRPEWNDIKVTVMEKLLWKKFEHPFLREMLLETGDAPLIEGNTWGDVFWGQCKGKGENHLGRLLMDTRARIRGSQ